jgi:transglutaminase-like putative cysteine protease
MERLARVALAALVGAAGFAFIRRPLPAAPWFALALASVFWQVRAPEALVIAVRRAVLAIVGIVVVLGWTLMSYPVLSATAEALLTAACGYALLVLSCASLLAPRFPRPSTLYPSIAALLALACYDPAAHVRVAVIVAALALFVFLLVTPARRWTLSRVALLTLYVVPAVLIARAVVGFLPLAQTRVEEYALGMTGSTASSSGMSAHVRLGALSSLKLSSQIVLRVFAPSARKLRGRVYVAFDGRGWNAAPAEAGSLRPLEPAALAPALVAWAGAIPGMSFGRSDTPVAPAAAGQIPSRIVQRLVTPGLLVAPGGVSIVRAPVAAMGLDTFGLLRPAADAAPEVYGVVSATGDVTVPGPADPRLLTACLDLPAETDPRFSELAKRLGAGLTTPQKLERTVSYVAGACHYSLEPGTFRTRQPVAEFLFDKKLGYCEYFASAAAILLRLQGVPTRYVTGYNVQEDNRVAGHYLVREADAHAWIEAYVPEVGWVEADPTPAAEYDALHADRPDALAAVFEWARTQWGALSLWARFGDWKPRLLVTGAALGLVGFLAAVRAWLRQRRARTPLRPSREGAGTAVRPELRELLARLERLWARAGHPRPPSRAPLEHASSLPGEAALRNLRDTGVRVVECYYRERFGGVPAPDDEIRDLLSRLASVTSV